MPLSPRTATVRKTFTFDAAHQLPNHGGKCRHLHGHTYRVEIAATGPIRPGDGESAEGMVLDFGVIKDAWQRLHDQLDHRNLNRALPSAYHPTTAENIAAFIFDELRDALPELTAVWVWETPTSSAEVRA